jgi:hypothetical protein
MRLEVIRSIEADPSDLMRSFPAEPMRIWPFTRVNQPGNDDPSIVEPIELNAATAWWRREV